MFHNLQMITRQLYPHLVEHLAQFPAVALLGPRQAGKTTLAEVLCAQRESCLYLDLESPTDRNKLLDPEAYLSQHEDKLVILDEVQRLPELFQPLRSLIDRGRKKGCITDASCCWGLPPVICCGNRVKASRGGLRIWNCRRFR